MANGRVVVHVHASLIAAFFTLLEWFIAIIPVKFVAAHFEGRSALASGVLNVL